MIAGTWTATCLMLTATAGTLPVPADVAPVAKSKFEIPIKIVPEQRPNIRSLELYSSRNLGKTWEQVGTARPEQSGFPFRAQADGIYWFTVIVRDHQGKAEPPDPSKAPVGLKVLVDTEKPDVRIVSAERRGDTITVRWEAREENPNLSTFRLEYRSTDGSGEWTAIPSTQALAGQAQFHCATAVTVRASLADVAKNAGQSPEVKVAGAGVITASAQSLETPPSGTGSAAGTAAAATSPVIPQVPVVSPPAPIGPSVAGQSTTGTESSLAIGSSSKPSDIGPAPSTPDKSKPAVAVKREGSSNVVAASPPEGRSAVAPAPLSQPATEREPGTQVVNNPRVTLEYQVDEFGPSGVGGVDLYMTQDNGLSWQRVEAEAGPTRSGQPQHRTLSVTLGKDGAYGFSIVLRSGAGLSMEKPRDGNAPQMRVELDTKAPYAELYRPMPSPGQRDALVVRWKANDKNLGARPVVLEWAEQLRGEWKPLGERQMANTGSFTWQVPKDTPPKVYLRLTVRDRAGNVAVAETAEPIMVDLVKPKGHLIGIVRAGGQ